MAGLNTHALPMLAVVVAMHAGAQPPPIPLESPQVTSRKPGELAPPQTTRATPTVFDDRIRAIATTYRSFRRVTEHASWSPFKCFGPTYQGVQTSVSRDNDTHGRKLYYLRAVNAPAYYAIGAADSDQHVSFSAATSPIGQVVVKETFEPELVSPAPKDDLENPTTLPLARSQPSADSGTNSDTVAIPHRRDDLGYYQPGAPAGLFIMLKLDPLTPDTDEGWVYATTAPDGETILEAGRIESCMDCHKETTRDRLYGARWTWPKDKAGKPIPPLKAGGKFE